MKNIILNLKICCQEIRLLFNYKFIDDILFCRNSQHLLLDNKM